jgi:hypothetical protein
MAQEFVVASMRRRRNTIQQQYRQAYLGSEGNVIDVPGRTGFVYVRYPGGVDENGYARFQQATIVRSAIGAAYLPNIGATVVIGNDADGFDAVITGAWAQAIQSGITPAITNPLRREARYTTTDSYIPLMSYPVATGSSDSTLVTVREWIYSDDNGNYTRYQGTQLEADKVDLSSYVPAAGEHRYVVIWLDTWLEAQGFTPEVVTASIAQAVTIALDDTDLEECYDDRPPDAVPIKAYRLADNQTTIRQTALDVDLRQMINTPRLWGFPKVITHRERIWTNRQQVVSGQLVINKQLIIEDLGQVVIL